MKPTAGKGVVPDLGQGATEGAFVSRVQAQGQRCRSPLPHTHRVEVSESFAPALALLPFLSLLN